MILATIRVSGVQALTHDYPSIPAGLVGAEVAFVFEDPLWDALTKTAVFRGCVTRDVLMTGDTVRIPAETVDQRGPRLMVGVYGTDADNNVVIPTLWCPLGSIRDAADPSGDPGTDPDPPVWAQLQERIEKMEKAVSSFAASDWDAAAGEPGHVLNRTHYADMLYVEILAETTGIVEEEMGVLIVDADLTPDTTYRIRWAGNEYVRTAIGVDDAVLLGDDGDPFLLECVGGSIDVHPLDGSTTVTIAIDKATGEDVHQLDRKFIPVDPTLTQPGMAADASAVGEALGKQSGGFVVQDTAPEDTSLLWVDTSDNTEEPAPLELDTTLTQPGMAADAAAVGEAIRKSSGGNVELDTTLSVEGKAADAKAVGDALADKLSADALPTAINDALAQAKESGEFDGADGTNGTDGADGVSATHAWNGTTLTITSASGTSSADLKGEQGEQGDPGYTPVKGTDYYTDADKTEMVNLVLSALPTWTGGSY